MSSKETNLKEKFRIALNSTAKVISDDFDLNKKNLEEKKTKDIISLEIDNLTNPSDFIRLRAETDSSALKKKFSDELIYKKNLPKNTSSKSLYNIAEKIRYEALGGQMLKGIEKNFHENYSQIINRKRKDQLKTKEDVPVSEAFELYMLKNFHKIQLNALTSRMLNFWEKDFENSIEKHKEFLMNNLEDQNTYSSKFSQILEEMDIFQSDEDDEKEKENQDQGQDNPSNDDQNSDNEDNKDENNDQETQASLDADYSVDEFNLDEQLSEIESKEQLKEVLNWPVDNVLLHNQTYFNSYYDLYPEFVYYLDRVYGNETLTIARVSEKMKVKQISELIDLGVNELKRFDLNFDEEREWKNWQNINRIDSVFYSEPYSAIVHNTQEFGPTLKTTDFGFFKNQEVKVKVSAQLKMWEIKNELYFVVQLVTNGEVISYQTVDVTTLFEETGKWSKVTCGFDLPMIKSENVEFGFYIWNKGKAEVFYDDLSLKFFEK
mgnify:CR=1 FL=1